MYKQPQDPANSAAALKFFDWAYTKGDKAAEELDYVPLPDAVTAQIEKTWAEIKGPDGKPVYSRRNNIQQSDRGDPPMAPIRLSTGGISGSTAQRT